MTLYSILRYLGLARRQIVESTISKIERDEAAARQRVLDERQRILDKRDEN